MPDPNSLTAHSLTANPLADLRDIHLPPPVSAWPPGKGYYTLLALFIFLYFIYRFYQKKRAQAAPKREALKTLSNIEADYKAHQKTKQTAAAITTLLKQITLAYHPRIDVASLHGQAWLSFLQKNSSHIDFYALEKSLLEAPFNPKSNHDLSPLFLATKRFIQQRSHRCLN